MSKNEEPSFLFLFIWTIITIIISVVAFFIGYHTGVGNINNEYKSVISYHYVCTKLDACNSLEFKCNP